MLDNAINGFANAMRDAGVIPASTIIADGKLHRAHAEGDKAGTLNLAYVLHLDGKPAGWWLHFSTGNTGKWTASGRREPMTQAMRQQIEYSREIRQKETEANHANAAQKAAWIWANAKACTEHPYLTRKRIKPYCIKLWGECLAIPLYGESGSIVNLQFIQPDGAKRFLTGGRKKECFFTIGDFGDIVLICEGFATGASLHQDTGKAVMVAFDAGNLKPVAEVIWLKYPNAEIIIAGDNDESGAGQKSANEAALAVGGKVLIPPVEGMDWNDYVNSGEVAA